MSTDPSVRTPAGGDLPDRFCEDVRAGLTSSPKWLPTKWLYDARGSELFDAITRMPVYYLTRAERAILEQHSAEVARRTSARTLVDLGSGSADKTRLLVDALRAVGALRCLVPVDVSATALDQASRDLLADYAELDVRSLVGDFDVPLGLSCHDNPVLVAFLGNTLGNLAPPARHRFLCGLREQLGAADGVLLGTDLVKDEASMVPAYDDAAGVTAAFNKNLLTVLNRELGADFAHEAFVHVAMWNRSRELVDIGLRSRVEQRVALPELGLAVDFGEGERLRNAVSAKFRRAGLGCELARAGFALGRWWTDREASYALSLALPA